VVASGIGVGLVTAAVITQAVATGLYIDIAVRTDAAADGTTADYSSVITTMADERDKAIVERDLAQYLRTLTQIPADNAKQSAQDQIDDIVAAAIFFDDPANSDTPSDQALFTTMTAAQAAIDDERAANKAYELAIGEVEVKITDIYANLTLFPEFDPQAGGATVPASDGVSIELQTVIVDGLCTADPIDACVTLATLRSDGATALTSWNAQIAQVTTTYNAAQTAAGDYLIYNSGDTNASPPVEPYNYTCRSVNCVLPDWVRNALGDPTLPREMTDAEKADLTFGTFALQCWFANDCPVVPQINGSYMDYSAKKLVDDRALDDLQAKQLAVDSATNAVAAFQCLLDPENDGFFVLPLTAPPVVDPADYPSTIDENTGQCIEIVAGNQTPGTVAGTPLEILNVADQQGVAQ
jgi:hypothetical protein